MSCYVRCNLQQGFYDRRTAQETRLGTHRLRPGNNVVDPRWLQNIPELSEMEPVIVQQFVLPRSKHNYIRSENGKAPSIPKCPVESNDHADPGTPQVVKQETPPPT